MTDFWGSNVWGSVLLFCGLLTALLLGNMLKRSVPFLKRSLVPTSVIGGALVLTFTALWRVISGESFMEADFFNGKGYDLLEILTYHCLALGFIAQTLCSSKRKFDKERNKDIFNTGVSTVSTYLIQAIVGMGITVVASFVIEGFFPAAGILLPFGYGQGTGQALNYGNIYEIEHGFVGGKSFGLTVAAMGFLSAAIGGVIHTNVQHKRGKLVLSDKSKETVKPEDVQGEGEIPMQESVDKMTVQFALIGVSYLIAYGLMWLLGKILPSMKSVIFGFNFLLGVIAAILVKGVKNFLHKKNIIHREYGNNFLLTRASNFFFDFMIVTGVAAIRLEMLERYWGILLILGVVGLVITYIYQRIICRVLFPHYCEEQFLAMYGMLTGTASSGIILLREVDGNFETPAAENLVYQNLPAIVFGFPMMLLANLAPDRPYLTLIILVLFFLMMNVILFRQFLFKPAKKKGK